MKSYSFAKYDDAPDITLKLTAQLPAYKDFGSLAAADAFYQREAECLVDALMAALPQGTMHRICQEVLRRYSSVYCGPMVVRNAEGTLQ